MTHSSRPAPLLMQRMLWLLACIASGGQTHAQIRTDGSVGPAAQNLLGPSYQIPQTLGKLAGSNLFHSFQTFNIGSGQSATFSTSTSGINNVISRVTGGQISQINGALNLSAASGSPAFYFINPAGVTFGAGASVDVPGAFHISSANSVKFADGRFNADLNQASSFSTAAPEAFGFLGNSRAGIRVENGAVLSPRGTFPISVIAGDIALTDGGRIGARNGEIRVVAVGGVASDIPFTGQIPKVEGSLSVSNGADILSLSRGELPPGRVIVHAGHIALSDAGNITSKTTGSGDAAGIQIQSTTAGLDTNGYVFSVVLEGGSGKGADIDMKIAQGLSVSQNASVSTETLGGGQAGHVRVLAGQVRVDSAAYVESKAWDGSTGATGNVDVIAKNLIAVADAGSRISVRAESSGEAGTLRLVATDIALSKGAIVYNFSLYGTANAGDITLSAEKSITLTDASTVISTSIGLGNSGNVALSSGSISLDGNSYISTGATESGGISKGGSVSIDIPGTLDIRNNSFINSGTASNGDAGSITIRARDVNLENGRITSFVGGGSGNGGLIDLIATGGVTLNNNGSILANSFSLGNAGSVSISSARLSLSGGSSIGSKSQGDAPSTGEVVAGGNAGNIRIVTQGALTIQGGNISSSTTTTGQGGSVDVSANSIALDGSSSNINAAAQLGSTGKAGSVNLSAADSIALSNGAFITTLNSAVVARSKEQPVSLLSLAAPRISVVSAGRVSADATGQMSAGSIDVTAGELSLTRGLITTTAELGNGGNISVRSTLLRLREAQITTSVQADPSATGTVTGFGNGGDIRIDADALVLQTGFIQANTDAQSASGGLIKLNVNTRVASGNTLFVGGQDPIKFNPNLFAFNVIQAAAPTGISGAIQTTTPVLDLTGSLGRVNAQVLDGVALGRDPCQTNAASSLAVVGRGGLPVSNRALLGAPSTSSSVVPATTALPQPGFNSPPQHVQLARASIGCTR